MSKQIVSQDLFLRVKERLDYHRLPSQFPIEATPLINKLLGIIDGNIENRDRKQVVKIQSLAENALKHEIARLVKENNQLHLTIINAKQQIQSLEHRVYKFDANRHSKQAEIQRYEQFKEKRQEQLINENREIKYKYNELMDFLHEDPNHEKEYIKRLMKHKQIAVQQHRQESQKQDSPGTNKQSKQFKVKQLEQKILHRDQQISRLHKLLEYDGVNLNKLINNFNQHLVKQQLNSADSKINYLETSYDKIKRENSKMKSNNGSKEALRAEVENCHYIIQRLKQENNELKRNSKEQVFNLQRRNTENNRNINKAQSEKQNVDNIVAKNELIIKDLNKKIQFLQKELAQARKLQQISEQKAVGVQKDNSKLLKKQEQNKVFFEYQNENIKKKLRQTEFQLQQALLKNKQISKELDIIYKESQLKSQSINNLQKIVNELIKKNSLLAGNVAFTVQESFKRSEDLEVKKRLIQLEQRLIHSQNQRAELQINLKTVEHRLVQVVKQNQRFKYQNGELRQHISKGQLGNNKLLREIQQGKLLLKRQQTQHARMVSQYNEQLYQKQSLILELKEENEKLTHLEKSSKMRLKDLQIKISEEQGVWQVTRIRLQQKESRIKQLQKLLAEASEQKKTLTDKLNELQQQAHQARRQKHRIAKKYDQVQKDTESFKETSFKNYSAAINDNINEVNGLKKELIRLNQANQNMRIRYDQVTNLLNVIRRQKQLVQFEKLGCERENEALNDRLYQMQELERVLMTQNENLRTLARRT